MSENNITEAVNNIPKTFTPNDHETDEKISIRRAKADSITIYEVSESELSMIETGSPNSIYLNFTTFFVGIFLSFLSILLTVDLKEKIIILFVFIVIAIVSGFCSLIMVILWLREKKDLTNVIKRIKNRIK